MKRTIEGMVEAGAPLMQQALQALREHREAQQSGAEPEEVERLRILAESLFQAVTDYQLRALGGPSNTLH